MTSARHATESRTGARTTRAGAIRWSAGLIAALTLAACGGEAAGGGGDESSAPDPSAEAVAMAVGSTHVPQNMDPAQGTGIAQALPYLDPVYDRLLKIDPEGVLVPGLATEWAVSEDGAVLELVLREGVTFSDGEPFNAEAVKANLDRYKNEGVPYIQNLLKSVDSVEVVDEFRVQINLVEGLGAELPDNLSSLPGFMVSPAAFDNEDLEVNPVGTGAYEVAPGGFTAGQSVSYVRKDEYWGGEDVYRSPELQVFGYNDANAALNALQNGQIDLFANRLNERFASFEESPDFVTHTSPTGGYIQIRLNMTEGPLTDVRVRQALSYALDRSQLSEAIWGDERACEPTAQPLPPGPGHVAQLQEAYPYDPERARELLAEAGYSELTLSGLFIPSDPPSNAFTQIVQAMWEDVGVTGDFTSTTIPQFIETWSSGEAEMSPSSTSLQYRGQVLARYVDDPTLLGDTPQEVLDAAEGYFDPSLSDEERTAKWEDISRAVVETVSGAIIACHGTVAVIADAAVTGIDQMGSIQRGSFDLENVYKAG